MSNYFTIEDVAKGLRRKEISPVDLVEELLRTIRTLDPQFNAFITVIEEEARLQAKELEAELASGFVRGPLHGVPIAIKDNLQTKGILTTAGSKIFDRWIPDEDASVVKQLKQAGAIIIGKANLHEFAMGATNENPHYGNARNPWDVDRIPGGSSGGSAVAIASGMAFGAIGTDTAGSIRLPAAMCGIVGIKPTYGTVSSHGCVPFSWSLDHVGPMAKTVRDCAILLESIKGFDQTMLKGEDSVHFALLDSLKGLRIGVMEKYFMESLDIEVQELMQKAIQQLSQLGAEIIPIELESLDEGLNALRVIAQSEGFAFHQPILEKYSHDYGEDVQFRFQFGKSITAAQYVNAQRIRKSFVQKTLEIMKRVDVLIGPTNSKTPYMIGTVPPKEAINNMFTLGKTPLANILGFPALTVPCGFIQNKWPVGLQIIGKPYSEQLLFQIGDCYERSEQHVNALKNLSMKLKVNV